MKESEIRKLFMLIQNAYSNFTYDDFKVECWRTILGDTPFETAETNLLRHIRTSSFQPTPADVIGKKEQRDGPYIPNVEETRRMLAERDEWAKTAVPPPLPPWKRESLPEGGDGTCH